MHLRYLFSLFLIIVISQLTACGGVDTINDIDRADTLAELPRVRLPQANTFEPGSLAVIAEGYREALALIGDPVMREDILRRLALLDLRVAEDRQINDEMTPAKNIYANAINTYTVLLAEQQYRIDNDKLLYPLAKAYELSGDIDSALDVLTRIAQDFPQSEYYSEVQFRRGEILFSREQYLAAAEAYQGVVNRQEMTPFLYNAWYMMGWSQFKLYRYEAAQNAFIAVIDEFAKGEAWQSNFNLVNSFNDVSDLSSKTNIDPANTASTEIKKGRDLALLDDAFHAMRLSFYYTEGMNSIDALLARQGERHYAPRLYADLGAFYLEKKRYRDSADTYAAFVERFPESAYAPRFSVSRITSFELGEFPDEVREEKQLFSKRYSVTSNYWQQTDDSTRHYVKGQLRIYINELAAYYHGLAQQEKEALQSQKQPTVVAENKVIELYRQAGNWYQAWIDSFPNEPDLANSWFLLGETRFESRDYRDAVAAYENAAYGYNDFAKANEAGYAALLSYDRVLSAIDRNRQLIEADEKAYRATMEEYNQWRFSRIDSALLFSETFVADVRRVPILAQTAQTLYELNDYQRTILVADRLLDAVDKDQEWRNKAFLLKGHSYMDMTDFVQAEQAYEYALGAQQAISRNIDPNSSQGVFFTKQYKETLENYAASIYKQGEAANSEGDPELAAQLFLRVVEQAPDSDIRVTAQYDAAVLLMQTLQWQSAIEVLQDFQQRFPSSPQRASIPSQLLTAYEGLEDWGNAAKQASVIARTDPDVEVRREALYTAASFYQRAGDVQQAITAYESYAREFPRPLVENMEAQYAVVSLYREQGQAGRTGPWLSRMIQTNDQAVAPTERTRYLAAWAAIEVAEGYYQTYDAITLRAPVKQSLAKKRDSLKVTIASYEKAASYDIEQFTTQSTHRIAAIYASLATALMESERPVGLNALELEQYDILLEEQAYPFEEQAIEFYEVNVERVWQGARGDWVKASFDALGKLLPARYGKQEIRPER